MNKCDLCGRITHHIHVLNENELPINIPIGKCFDEQTNQYKLITKNVKNICSICIDSIMYIVSNNDYYQTLINNNDNVLKVFKFE